MKFPEEAQMGDQIAKLKFWLYGMRPAAKGWEEDYAKRFKVWRNRPENDLNWNEGGKWLGVASMSARHRSDECVSNTRGLSVSWSGRSQPERNTRVSAGL